MSIESDLWLTLATFDFIENFEQNLFINFKYTNLVSKRKTYIPATNINVQVPSIIHPPKAEESSCDQQIKML